MLSTAVPVRSISANLRIMHNMFACIHSKADDPTWDVGALVDTWGLGDEHLLGWSSHCWNGVDRPIRH